MHIRQRHLKPIAKFSIPYLFFSIGIAAVSTIWSVYMNSFLNNSSLVGFLTSIFIVLEVLAYIFLIPMIEKRNKVKLLIICLLFFAVSYLLFSVYSNIFLVIILGALIAVATSLRTTANGLIVRDSSESYNVSKNEGIIYALLNIAWFVGPLIAGYIASTYGINNVFFFASAIILLSVIIMNFLKVKDDRKTKDIDKHIFRMIANFFRDKNRVLIYIISLSVPFWWAFIYVYMPIYIIDSGLSSFTLGLFISGVTIPLIFGDYIFARIAGKKGFRKLFFTGFLSLGILAASLFFISNIYLILALLVLASISVSMIEPTIEAYFLDITEEEERDKYYGIYTTSSQLGTLIGAGAAAAFLAFLPFNYLFLLFGIPMVFFAFLSLKIKESYESEKK
ncbi:MAG TPA: MFS transporter [Candidatus Omnitrophota bacterium]|nr:MFS transporter [Candidatus Omnitrophota bacterium]